MKGGICHISAGQVDPRKISFLEISTLQVAGPTLLQRAGNQVGDRARNEWTRSNCQDCCQYDPHFWPLLYLNWISYDF